MVLRLNNAALETVLCVGAYRLLDYLDAICDHFWQRIIGNQTREEFAALTLDAGQSIKDAWNEALAHAENL